jgi:hypothetical protein
MRCCSKNIFNIFQFCTSELPKQIYIALDRHIEYCFKCQLRFMAIEDSLLNNSCSIDQAGLNEILEYSYSGDPPRWCKGTGLKLITKEELLPSSKDKDISFEQLRIQLRERRVELQKQRGRLQEQRGRLQEQQQRLLYIIKNARKVVSV